MKGIFFTEFIEMIENEFGNDITEKVITDLNISNDGVFDPAGDYSSHLFTLLISLTSHEVRIPPSDLSKTFGEHLFSRLIILYRPDFAANSDIFGFLERIDYFINVKLQQYFPHKGLKGFSATRINENSISISYGLNPDLMELAVGLFMGCQKFFNEDMTLSTEFMKADQDSSIQFTLTRNEVLI